MRILVTAMAAAVAVACTGTPQQAHRHRTSPAPTSLSSVQACQLLLSDVTRNGGIADVTALGHIADQVTAPRMAADARTAVRDIDHTGIAPVALSLLRDDCARAGVHIPPP